MRRSVAAVLVALSTALAVLPATSGSAATVSTASSGGRSATAGAARDHAVRVLDRVADLLGGTPARALDRSGRPGPRTDATLALSDLFRVLPELTGANRARAEGLLARPTNGASDPYGDGYLVPATKTCSTHFCLHWVTSTADAPPNRAWVDKTLSTMDKVWQLEVKDLGYRAPIKDGTHGGNDKFDVYLKDVGGKGLYGYCAPEYRAPGEKYLASGYCVLDDDFARSQFGAPPTSSLKVTAAHEFFHAIQFGYDYAEDQWFMEATATWMEERFADDVNDNRQYLPYGQVKRPGTSLDIFQKGGFNQYGNWPFFEYLGERYGNGIVRAIWNKAYAAKGAPDAYSIQAVRQVLNARSGFLDVFGAYSAANAVAARAYAEGSHWPQANVAKRWLLGKSAPRGQATPSIDHLASQHLVLKPDQSLQGNRWAARVTIDAPGRSTSPAAYLVVKKKNAPWVTKGIPLSRGGYGQVTFGFSTASVASATITLVNGSTRYQCWQNGTVYSCQGHPRDEDKSFAVKVAVFKR